MKLNRRLYETCIGDLDIYQSPDVFQNKTSSTLENPVHKDSRGVIQRLNGSNLDWINEYGLSTPPPNILYTRAGFMRSGDLHKNIQYDVVLSGKIELWTFQKGRTVKPPINPNMLIIINSHIPHLFKFLEDTLMIEWWGGPFESWYYKPYRDLIEQNFKDMAKQP